MVKRPLHNPSNTKYFSVFIQILELLGEFIIFIMGKHLKNIVEFESCKGIRASMKAILLFSGGRDSTLSALKLAEKGYELSLLTVKTNHLEQYDQFERRLAEIRCSIDVDSHIITLNDNTSEENCIFTDVCLDCQALFILSALHLSKQLDIQTICTGYTDYQDRFPEQGKDSIQALKTYVFSSRNIEFFTPVYKISTKTEIIRELAKYPGISTEALEQKCKIRQKGAIHPSLVDGEIVKWAKFIDKADREDSISKILITKEQI